MLWLGGIPDELLGFVLQREALGRGRWRCVPLRVFELYFTEVRKVTRGKPPSTAGNPNLEVFGQPVQNKFCMIFKVTLTKLTG